MSDERVNILKATVDHRQREVLHHQINIDNYRLAIAEIEQNHADDASLMDFSSKLRTLLDESIREQTKEKIMLLVAERQLAEADQ